MIIGIDIDDTLVNTSQSFDNVIKKYNVNFNKKFKDDWTKEEFEFIFNHYLKEILLSAKLNEGAKEVIDYLNDKNYKLIVITARSNRYDASIPEETIKQLKSENINITEFYFDEEEKASLAKKLKLDLMIDDSHHVYENMKKENIDCILFGDKIKTWKEVLEYIKQKEV